MTVVVGIRKVMQKIILSILLAVLAVSPVMADQNEWYSHFDFTGSERVQGVVKVSSTNIFSGSALFGFEPGASVVAGSNCITSDKPFLFSVNLPDGNYSVTATSRTASG